jgi:hypothetical protein
VAVNEAVNRARDGGKDATGLGRWVWMRFQGKEGHMTRVVSVYRPCCTSNKELSVWEQQVRYFRGKLKQDKNTRQALYEDLFIGRNDWAVPALGKH